MKTKKILFEDSDLANFWLNAPKKYACLKNEATKALVQKACFGSHPRTFFARLTWVQTGLIILLQFF